MYDPYREFNQATLRWLRSLSDAEHMKLLKSAGIYDRHGNLAKKYRTPEAELSPSAKGVRGRNGTAKHGAKRGRVGIGSLVRFRLGNRRVLATVTVDRGMIGEDGRHVVTVRLRPQDGERGSLDMPLDDLELVSGRTRKTG